MASEAEMLSNGAAVLSPRESIDILLKEYDTLRAEIIARTTGGIQLVGISALLFAAVVSWIAAHSIDRVFWCLLSVFVAVSALFFYVSYREINLAAKQLQRLEARVNRLAGAKLLTWESERGGAKGGWIRRRQPPSPSV